MDEVYAETDQQLLTLEAMYNDSNSPNYQNGLWYRQMHSQILGSAYTLRQQFYAKNPTKERAPTTQEQKWSADYMENVIKASVDAQGSSDFYKQEQLDRLWRAENGPEASALIDREYIASTSLLDQQFRADTIELRPYFKFEDSAWAQDFLYPESGSEKVVLPMLSNGQKPLNFRTGGEYRAALRADFVLELQTAGKLPDVYAYIPTGEENRLDHIAVSGKCQLATQFKDGRVIQSIQYRVSQVRYEELFN
jgi:hypothetical protein